MTFYLRNNKDENLLDVEVWLKESESGGEDYVELKSMVLIKPYSNLLLDNIKKKARIIEDFKNLSELRGWLWERHFMIDKNNDSQLDTVIQKLRVILVKVAKDYELTLVVD